MLDISTDYLIFDNKETVTHYNLSNVSRIINNVVRRPSILATQDQMGTTIYSASQRFVIFKSEVSGGFTPKVNEKLVDSNGKSYYIDSVNDGRLRTSWVVDCTQKTNEGVS
jgi:hypothetical protein